MFAVEPGAGFTEAVKKGRHPALDALIF